MPPWDVNYIEVLYKLLEMAFKPPDVHEIEFSSQMYT